MTTKHIIQVKNIEDTQPKDLEIVCTYVNDYLGSGWEVVCWDSTNQTGYTSDGREYSKLSFTNWFSLEGI